MADKKEITDRGLRCECGHHISVHENNTCGGPLGINVYYKETPTKHTVACSCKEFKPKA